MSFEKDSQLGSNEDINQTELALDIVLGWPVIVKSAIRRDNTLLPCRKRARNEKSPANAHIIKTMGSKYLFTVAYGIYSHPKHVSQEDP